jgi:large subunit ribosomal protein L15
MIKLHSLTKSTTPSSKRRGRGYGSGKGGHTTGRGQKGQTSRSSLAIWFEGGQLPQIRRFPYIRGKSRFKSLTGNTITIGLNSLNAFKANSTVTLKSLVEQELVSQKDVRLRGVKIVGNGNLTKSLTLAVPVSANARQKIEAAGGKVLSEPAG